MSKGLYSLLGLEPNAGAQPLPEAGAMQGRTLEAVGCSALFGHLLTTQTRRDPSFEPASDWLTSRDHIRLGIVVGHAPAIPEAANCNR